MSPRPILCSLTPNTTSAGSPAFTLTLDGSNFMPGAVVTWNGVSRPATFVNSNRLRTNVSVADVASPDIVQFDAEHDLGRKPGVYLNLRWFKLYARGRCHLERR